MIQTLFGRVIVSELIEKLIIQSVCITVTMNEKGIDAGFERDLESYLCTYLSFLSLPSGNCEITLYEVTLHFIMTLSIL